MTIIITDYMPYAIDGEFQGPKTYTLGEAVKTMVDQSPDYHDGQLDGLVRKVEALTEITANLAEAVRPHLSDENIMSIVGYPLMIDGDEDDT